MHLCLKVSGLAKKLHIAQNSVLASSEMQIPVHCSLHWLLLEQRIEVEVLGLFIFVFSIGKAKDMQITVSSSNNSDP